jgi:hypothetical protein
MFRIHSAEFLHRRAWIGYKVKKVKKTAVARAGALFELERGVFQFVIANKTRTNFSTTTGTYYRYVGALQTVLLRP